MYKEYLNHTLGLTLLALGLVLRALNTLSCYLSYLSVICELGVQLYVNVSLATSNLLKSFLDLPLQLPQPCASRLHAGPNVVPVLVDLLQV